MLKDLQDALGLTLLFISHDLAVVQQMCDQVLVMKDGEIVKAENCDQVLVEPVADYIKGLLASMPRFGFGEYVSN